MVCVAACTQQEVLSGEQNDSGLDSPVLGGVGGRCCGTGGGAHRAAHVPTSSQPSVVIVCMHVVWLKGQTK